MFVNTNIIKSNNMFLTDYATLLLIKQNKVDGENCSVYLRENMLEDRFDLYQERGWIEFIKPKNKSQDKFDLVRISSEGNNLLDLITTPDIDEGDVKMANYLMDMYLKGGDDRSIGSKKNVIKYTGQFRKYVALSLYEMYWLCDLFIKEVKYTVVLEKIFFDANKHRYGYFLNHIHESKLYQFYENNKEMVENYWKLKIKDYAENK